MILERFLGWVETADVGRRTEAAHAMARVYLHTALSDEERDGIEAALTVLLDDAAPDVRLAMAEELAASDKAPHHIILSLAADQSPIAAIVAERSPLLLDTELVDMIAVRDRTVQMAVARRPFVSRALSAAVSEVACVEACVELLCNGGARLRRFSLDRIVERFGDDARLRETLLARADLPLVIRQALLARLSDTLRNFMVERNLVRAERADLVVRDARERATIAIAFEAPAGEVPLLVERLIATGELTPAFLIRAVASGQTELFQAALAALSGLPAERVAALVASGRRAHLKGLLQKAKLPPRTFPAFAAAIDVIRSEQGAPATSDYRRATQLLDAILTRYPDSQDRELDQILALLRRFAAEAKREAARGYVQQIREAA